MAPLQVNQSLRFCWLDLSFNGSGVLVVYTLRVNMSVACVDMADDLNWTDAEKGLVLVRCCIISNNFGLSLFLSLLSIGVML